MRKVGRKLATAVALLSVCCGLGLPTGAQGQGVIPIDSLNGDGLEPAVFPVGVWSGSGWEMPSLPTIISSGAGFAMLVPTLNEIPSYANLIPFVQFPVLLALPDGAHIEAESSIVIMEVNRGWNEDKIGAGQFPPLPPTPLMSPEGAVVPEPGTGMLVGFGGLVLGFIRSLRRQRTAHLR